MPEATPPDPPGPTPPAPPRRPWWIPPFLGRIPPGVEEGHLRVLGFVAFAMLFENYDLGLIAAALPQIASDFGLSNPEKGSLMGSIEIGALAAFAIVPLADRFGRRRILLACVLGMSLGSFFTAFSPTVEFLAACQIVTRSFATAATVVSFVIVAEEFPAAHRGWGIGMLGAVGAVGFGLGALVYSQVHLLPHGWRSIYALGGLAVLFLPYFRRRIAETRRFQARARGFARTRNPLAGALHPLIELARHHPRRAAAIGLLAALSTAGHRPAFRFVSDFLQTDHGWTPGLYASLTILGGLLGVLGNPVAGRLGDRFGRRHVGAAMLLPFPLVAALFYMGPAWLVVAPWIAMVFLAMAASVIVRSLATELFPTGSRSSAGGWVLMMETLGAAAGLFVFAGLEARIEAWGTALAAVSLATVLSAAFLYFLPDTHGRELESTSGE